ncbi:hypothetical protein FK515_30490, partial [Klebsiella pneumoniae]|nr:hypothetical protein [Klebsiella pneumoniae]
AKNNCYWKSGFIDSWRLCKIELPLDLCIFFGLVCFFFFKVPYRLHAVLVHEGQANAGHYWAYIYDHHQNRWMKYNDISVTKSTWEELERDSFGG